MTRYLTAAAIALSGFATTAIALPSHAVAAPATVQTRTFAIGKMTCATCPIAVKTAMSRVAGVKTVKVNFGAKIAVVTYDATVTTPAKIAAASTGVGFPAKLRSN
jgi:mercuric ion binding protein